MGRSQNRCLVGVLDSGHIWIQKIIKKNQNNGGLASLDTYLKSAFASLEGRCLCFDGAEEDDDEREEDIDDVSGDTTAAADTADKEFGSETYALIV